MPCFFLILDGQVDWGWQKTLVDTIPTHYTANEVYKVELATPPTGPGQTGLTECPIQEDPGGTNV